MKLLALLPLLTLPFLPTLTDDEPAAEAPAPVRWLTDLGQATELAAESDRPLMIVFR